MNGLRGRLGARRGTGRRFGGRLVGGISTAVVGALIVTSMVVGVGSADTKTRVSEADSWLASLKSGSLVHVNGTTGQVDGRVELGNGTEGPLEVVEEGNTVLVLDQTTGVVTRIDPAQLSVAQTQSFEGGRLRIVAGDEDTAWVVDELAGTVRRIDPVTLAPVADAITMASRPIGAARVDGEGVLWVLLPDRGEAVPIGEEKAGTPVKVGAPGDPVSLTVADGRAAVVNVKAGTLAVLSAEDAGLTMRLPSGLLAADPAKLLVPENNVSPLVPLLAPDTGALVVANVDSGVVQAADLELAGKSYGPPQAHGPRVYVPDLAAGQLVVYDTLTAKFDQPVRVTGVPGKLDAYTRGDRLWVNDQANATAAVVDEDGVVHLIDKYDTNVPDVGSSPVPTSSVPPTSAPGREPDPRETADAPDDDAPVDRPYDDPAGAPQVDAQAPADTSSSENQGSDASAGDTKEPSAQSDEPVQPPQPAVTVTVTAPAPPAPVATTAPANPQPVNPQPSATTSAPGPAPVVPAETTSRPPATTPAPTPTQTTPPPPAKGPPGRPKAQTGSTGISITFTPSAGATPDRYELEGAPKGATVKPARVAAKGPFRFDITGLTCTKDAEYRFKVVAVYGTERFPSSESPAVRPCVAPGKPTITGQTRSNHQVVVNWKAPAGTGLTYLVTWKGEGSAPDGEAETSATSYTIKGLTNGKVYDVTVSAVNAAGKSAAATAEVDMTPPKKTLEVHHNRDDNVDMGIRNVPDSQEGGRAGAIPPGYEGEITVHCQVKGSTEHRLDGTGGDSAIWDKVTYKGTTGYLSDVYVTTSNSGKNAYSRELWQCE
ncbi:fibronectin type III domain-containing protein [Yinghuangia sp. YIM S10712]|uniref:fibronectin type III domain-containing protein n=1 Tax=Yinghuangia sp. YIM S10712 TaxID=3436930 RepID=UPI003F52E7A1